MNQITTKIYNKLLQDLEDKMNKVIKKYLPEEEHFTLKSKDSNYIRKKLKLFGIECIYTVTSSFFEPRYIRIMVNGIEVKRIKINSRILSEKIEKGELEL